LDPFASEEFEPDFAVGWLGAVALLSEPAAEPSVAVPGPGAGLAESELDAEQPT
jgi:hypothetical protein